MPIMIWIAIVIEFAIQNWIDAGILLFIQFANATLGWYETVKAADAVAALKASLKPLATVKRDGQWQQLDARNVVPGDLVMLGAGSACPADCVVNEGRIEVDQSALTGESLPVTMHAGDQPKMGSTITRGEVEATVEFTGKDTFFGKTASLLQESGGLGSLARLLLKIMGVLIVISITLCLIALLYLVLARDEEFKHALSFTIVLLVASIPIAIEIVCTTTLALGSRQLSKHGAIVTRLASIEEMAGMNMLCSDKTGTLTLNKMEIQEYCPTYSDYAKDYQETVQYAAMAAKWKEPPKDALDTMVLGAADLEALDTYEMVDHTPFDPTIKRTESIIKNTKTGEEFRVSKGAPQIISALVADSSVQERVAAEVQVQGARGIRCLAVARTTDKAMSSWVMLGVLTFLDPPRPDTKATIDAALDNGVDVKMVTGDQQLIAKEMSRILGLGTNIPDAAGLPVLEEGGKIPPNLGEKYGRMILEADGFAQVYPEHKYLIVEALRQQGFAVGMTGDGVNDAPALKRADVGIAVSGATDAARAAADMVLTQPGLSVVIEAILIARQIFQRVRNFINYRIAATLQLLLFFFIAVFAFPPQDYYCTATGENAFMLESDGEVREDLEQYCPSFFQLPVLMLMLITLLNDGTLISVGYDKATPSRRPEKWNLKVLFTISAILGLVSMGSSLLLVWAALDSPNDGSLFQKMDLPVPNYGQIVTMIYLKVSLSDFLTLFSARTNPGPFWSTVPAAILAAAAGVALGLSTILGCLWPAGKLEGTFVIGLALDYQLNTTLTPVEYAESMKITIPEGSSETQIEDLLNSEHGVEVQKNEFDESFVFIDYTYKLWPLWIWLFCLVFWFIQDAFKVITYWFLLKFDIFQARTAALVNIRGYTAPGQAPLGAEATGMVEKKLLGRKLDSAIGAIERIVSKKMGGRAPPALQRVSVTLAQARTSVAAPTERLSAQGPIADEQMADIQAAASEVRPYIPEEDAEGIESQLKEVQRVADRLKRVSAVMEEKK